MTYEFPGVDSILRLKINPVRIILYSVSHGHFNPVSCTVPVSSNRHPVLFFPLYYLVCPVALYPVRILYDTAVQQHPSTIYGTHQVSMTRNLSIKTFGNPLRRTILLPIINNIVADDAREVS